MNITVRILSLSILLGLVAGNLEKQCDYEELEKKMLNISGNKGRLFMAFYSPNTPSPKSVKVNYLMNGTEKRYTSDVCSNESWYWLSSAIFFIIPPKDLNSLALHIFGALSPLTGAFERSVDIQVPPIGSDCSFNTLQQFTMTVSRVYNYYSVFTQLLLNKLTSYLKVIVCEYVDPPNRIV